MRVINLSFKKSKTSVEVRNINPVFSNHLDYTIAQVCSIFSVYREVQELGTCGLSRILNFLVHAF